MRYGSLVTILALLLIAISISSVNPSLQQEISISNTGNILVQGTFANTIFFESGAESKKLTPPFDMAGGRNGGSTYSYAKVVSSPVRTGAKSIEIYQPPPVKTEGDRRVGVYKYAEPSYPREWYLSWWVYFPDESPWNTDDLDGWGTNIGGWKLSFGPPTNNHQWWTGTRFRVLKDSRELVVQYAWWDYPKIDVRKSWRYSSGFYINEHLNEWIHLQIYVKITAGSDSIVRAWINNDMIMDKTTWTDTIDGIRIFAAAPEAYPQWNQYDCDWHSSAPNGCPRIGIKLYDDYDSKEKRIWVDDIVWATEKVPETYGVVGK